MIIEKTNKIELSCDESGNMKIQVHRNPIKQELKGKLSDTDIDLALSLSENSVKLYQLIRNIAIGGKCEACSQANSKENSTLFSRCNPYGNYSSKAMFINAMPTELEYRTGCTHSDTTGVFLTLILNKMGIHKEQVYMTDFIKCHCKNPDPNALWHCAFQYLFQEISLLKPEIIICEGIGVMKKLEESQIFQGFPEKLEYGKVYAVKDNSSNRTLKIMSIYELNKVLLKTGEDYTKCKTAVWNQLSQVKNLIIGI